MPHHKHHEKLEKIKEAIETHPHLSEEEKSNALNHIKEWYLEDKAFGTFIEELTKISEKIEPILKEMGLI